MDKITIEREVVERAVATLAHCYTAIENMSDDEDALISRTSSALRAALAAQPAEPVAWRPCVNCGCDSTGKMTHCYGCPNDPATFKAPPAPAAVPLTDEQIDAIADSLVPDDFGGQIDWHRRYARAILAAAGDKT